MKIPYSKDVVNDACPSANKGTNPWDNPGIQPHESAVPDVPGDKAMNPVAPELFSKSAAYKPAKSGSGYTD